MMEERKEKLQNFCSGLISEEGINRIINMVDAPPEQTLPEEATLDEIIQFYLSLGE